MRAIAQHFACKQPFIDLLHAIIRVLPFKFDVNLDYSMMSRDNPSNLSPLDKN